MAITTYIHPGCGKRVPGGESGAHCSSCHKSFRGAAAYDRHLLRGPDGRLTHQDPATAVSPSGKPLDYWLDDKGIWHLGPRDPRFSSDADADEDEAEDEAA